MKKFSLSVIILCLTVICCGCGEKRDSVFSEGRFLRSNRGSYMIILDDIGPCVINPDEKTAQKFTDGDLIKIEYSGGILESYPMQISELYGAELIQDGDISDIDENILNDLKSMGWID